MNIVELAGVAGLPTFALGFTIGVLCSDAAKAVIQHWTRRLTDRLNG